MSAGSIRIMQLLEELSESRVKLHMLLSYMKRLTEVMKVEDAVLRLRIKINLYVGLIQTPHTKESGGGGMVCQERGTELLGRREYLLSHFCKGENIGKYLITQGMRAQAHKRHKQVEEEALGTHVEPNFQ